MVDWPRIVQLAVAVSVLAIQVFAWWWIRPAGWRRVLWGGFACLLVGICYGTVEVLSGDYTQYRVFLVTTGLAWLGAGFVQEIRATPHDTTRR